jgi:hypothetical protein
MNVKLKNLFSLVEKDSKYLQENVDKIQIARCPLKEQKCKEHLAIVNNYHAQSSNLFYNKNFQGAITSLKNAYYVTAELNESSCLKCADFFRLTISQSLENIHEDIRRMSSGIFKTNRYQASYKEADKVLNEFKDIKQNNIIKPKEQNHFFINRYSTKCVI